MIVLPISACAYIHLTPCKLAKPAHQVHGLRQPHIKNRADGTALRIADEIENTRCRSTYMRCLLGQHITIQQWFKLARRNRPGRDQASDQAMRCKQLHIAAQATVTDIEPRRGIRDRADQRHRQEHCNGAVAGPARLPCIAHFTHKFSQQHQVKFQLFLCRMCLQDTGRSGVCSDFKLEPTPATPRRGRQGPPCDQSHPYLQR